MNINKLFDLILKLKKKYCFLLFLFLKIFGINNFFDLNSMCSYLDEDKDKDDDDDDDKNKKFKLLVTFIKMTTPLRHYFYGLVAVSIISLSNKIDANTVLTILATVEIIDKSVVTLIEEMQEDIIKKELEKKKNNNN